MLFRVHPSFAETTTPHYSTTEDGTLQARTVLLADYARRIADRQRDAADRRPPPLERDAEGWWLIPAGRYVADGGLCGRITADIASGPATRERPGPGTEG